MKSLDGTLAGLQKSFEERQQREAQEAQEQQNKKEIERLHNEKNNLIQLDLWANNVRGVPNSVLRGSLFAATQGKNARYCQRETLHENESVKIVYTGKRLNQSQLDVWECALHLARLQNLGTKIDFTEHSFLKNMGRSTGKNDYEWLKDTFAILGACWIEITHKNLTYCGSLIEECYRDEETGRGVLVVNSKIARLYEDNRATWIQWDERQKIGKRKPLAQWLHGYLSTHAKWYPHKVETIKDLSGSETKNTKHFKANLLNALQHLKSIEIIKNYRVDEKNLVHIERPPNKAQQKHLEEKRID